MLATINRLLTGAALALALTSTTLVSAGPVAAKSQVVMSELSYPIGSIVIVNNDRALYYVLGEGRAIRYPIAVGKSSELWTGRSFVADKKVDPKWIPIDGKEPVEGGDPKNPLGKRALYLDWSLLRIHGTPSRGSIGAAVSNGCVRMLNEDVLDLYDRVHHGAPVFAINSLAENGSFLTDKAGTRVYVNPEARRIAKLEEEQAKLWRERGGYDGRYASDDYYSRWGGPPSRMDYRDDRRYDSGPFGSRGFYGWWR